MFEAKKCRKKTIDKANIQRYYASTAMKSDAAYSSRSAFRMPIPEAVVSIRRLVKEQRTCPPKLGLW
jgi:hypothetical protein